MIETLEETRQLRSQQKNKAANILLDQIINSSDVDSNIFYYAVIEKIDMLIQEKSFDEVIEIIDLAISKNIYKYNFLIKKGSVLKKIKPEDESIINKTFEDALAIEEGNFKKDPTVGDYYIDKARALNFLNRYIEAIETCEIGIELTADAPTLALLYRYIYICSNKYNFEDQNEDFTIFNKGFDYLLKAHSIDHAFQHDYMYELKEAKDIYERNQKIIEINQKIKLDPGNIFLHLNKIQQLYGKKKRTAIKNASTVSNKPYAEALLKFEQIFTANHSYSLQDLIEIMNEFESIIEILLTTKTNDMDTSERQLYKSYFKRICSYVGSLSESLGDKISNDKQKRAAYELAADLYELSNNASLAEMTNILGYGIFLNSRPQANLESALKLFKVRPKYL